MESLYTKYRPKTFADVVGQTHVVSTLERAVRESSISHAYLFCGPRGTGKTTLARILAKALLCQEGPGEMPDGTCEECQLIAAGNHPDVLEIDAASNTGVDNVREVIIGRVNYAPVRGNYKVYIVDEVHMLTTAAFNALLKTLEEPPANVVFVLCTTDPQRIPATILSRVQRFDFHAIASSEMRAHLEKVCHDEGIECADEALDLIVAHAHGGMRDALTTLEQAATFTNNKISVAAVRDLRGEVSEASLQQLSMAIARRDVPSLFSQLAGLADEGRDLLLLTRELAAHIRDVYVVSALGTTEGVLNVSEQDLLQLRTEADAFGSADRLARVLDVLGDASAEMRTAPNQRLVLEIALTRIARPASDLTLEALDERLRMLEQGGRVAAAAATPVRQTAAAPVEQSVPAQQPTPAVASSSMPVPETAPVQQPAPVTVQQPAPSQQSAPNASLAAESSASPADRTGTSDPAKLQRVWKTIVDATRERDAPRGALLLLSQLISDDGEKLVVALPTGSTFTNRMLDRKDVKDVIKGVVEEKLGVRELNFIELDLKNSASAMEAVPEPEPALEPDPVQAPAQQEPVQQEPMQQAPVQTPTQPPAVQTIGVQTPQTQTSETQSPKSQEPESQTSAQTSEAPEPKKAGNKALNAAVALLDDVFGPGVTASVMEREKLSAEEAAPTLVEDATASDEVFVDEFNFADVPDDYEDFDN